MASQADRKYTPGHGWAPSEKPTPPGFHLGLAGFHFLRRVDYDGRAGGLEVYQWQPGAELWCRPNEYSSGRDLDLIGYEYVAPCPLPMHDHEREKIDAVLADLKLRFTSGNSVPVERATISRDQYDALLEFFIRRL